LINTDAPNGVIHTRARAGLSANGRPAHIFSWTAKRDRFSGSGVAEDIAEVSGTGLVDQRAAAGRLTRGSLLIWLIGGKLNHLAQEIGIDRTRPVHRRAACHLQKTGACQCTCRGVDRAGDIEGAFRSSLRFAQRSGRCDLCVSADGAAALVCGANSLARRHRRACSAGQIFPRCPSA
jgi:hypothetical protein